MYQLSNREIKPEKRIYTQRKERIQNYKKFQLQ